MRNLLIYSDIVSNGAFKLPITDEIAYRIYVISNYILCVLMEIHISSMHFCSVGATGDLERTAGVPCSCVWFF